ncbi:MAG: hypothetical protein HWQ41_05525 [Nostoc sp. NOS(2021)]|nr:hypothetical protein [Nostoc sp. NOS(2021)]MBN3894731.1 hypothetical protein [Nostoc sp. NOS(2021)]
MKLLRKSDSAIAIYNYVYSSAIACLSTTVFIYYKIPQFFFIKGQSVAF